jgi:alkylation response protein AidB-like acyl-CoA dehydrogenase
MTDTHDAKLDAARADLAADGPAAPSAWQRLAPIDLRGDRGLAAIEAALDEPATAALLADLEARGAYPGPILERLRALGLADLFTTERATVWHLESLNALTARRDGSLAITIGVNALALLPAYIAATPDQLARIYARFRAGAAAAMLLTELPHGSNLLRNAARASREGTAFRLTGEKDIINGAARHDLLFTFARTREAGAEAGGRGDFTLLLVERDATVESLARWRTLPAHGADIGGVRFRETLVPEANAIGGEGEGFALVQKTLSISRGGISALASGAASRARDLAFRYAARRDIYGGPIAALGAIREHLLRIEALDLAAAALALKAAAVVNALGLGAAHYTAAAKLASCALAEEAVGEGRRVLGSRALLEDLPYARLVRDVLLYGLFDGTSHLMLDQLQWRLAQQSMAEAGGDPVPELARIYAAPPRPLVEVLRARAKTWLPPLEPHAAAFGGPAVLRLARALLGAVRALRARKRWDDDQALRFEAADIFGHFEAVLALAELAAPEGRAALGVAAADVDEHAARFAIGFLGARLAARARGLALVAGADADAGEAAFIEMRETARPPLAARLFGG